MLAVVAADRSSKMYKILTVLAVVMSAWCGTVLSQDSTLVTCNQTADILFIMDSSGSVGSTNFQSQLEFAARFTDRFIIGPTRFAVIRFDSSPVIVFDFDDHMDQASLKNAISGIAYPGGGTNTADALRLARESAFITGRGSRINVPKIAIVITDGQSNSLAATTSEADQLKKSGVLILSLGVGSADKVELDAMASFPQDVYELNDFNQLVQIVNEYSSMTCEVVKLFDCSPNADVFFLVDSSSQVMASPTNFQKALKFASDLVSQSKPPEYHFGAATFGGSVRKLFDMNALSSQQAVSQMLLSATSVGGATDTAAALSYVQTQNVFSPAQGGRQDAVKILIILTDGGSSSRNAAETLAQGLVASGVHILTVGIDSPAVAELQELAGSVSGSSFSSPSDAVFSRVQELATNRPCKLPSTPVKDITEACRMFNWINGIHPHPYICTKFIECTYLKTDILDCPEFLIYNPVLQTCDYPTGEFCFLNTNNIGMVTPTTPPCPPNGTAEVLLIIDGSGDVSLNTYDSMLTFASNLPENYNLGPNAIQFAAMTFSDRPNVLFNFDAYSAGQYKDLQHTILGAPYKGLGTNTASALQTANSFTAAEGVRPAVPQVALVFTEGKSDNPALTAQQAATLKAAGVFVVAIGSSNANRAELEAIASSPQAVYNVENDFNSVRDIITSYSHQTLSCTPNNDVTITHCRGIQYADVIFVLDSSNSIDGPSFIKQLNYVDNVTNNFDLGRSDAQFGTVIYGTDAQILFHLDAYSDHAALSKAILGATHMASGTDTAKALNLVTDQDMFGSAHGGRVNASKVLIVMTDGRSNSKNATVTAAQRLKDAGVRVFSIGISDSINQDELKGIASDRNSQFQVASYDALNTIIHDLTQEVCQSFKVPGSSSQSDSPMIADVPSYPPHYTNLCVMYQWADGLHPNPYDCSTYVRCSGFRTTVVSCSRGLVYDPVSQTCQVSARPCSDPNYWGPSVTVNPRQPLLPVTRPVTATPPPNYCDIHKLDNGLYPDPDFCYGFIECSNYISEHLDCPLGLAFDINSGKCGDTHDVDCNVNANYYIALIG